jgi:hypothetical protein
VLAEAIQLLRSGALQEGLDLLEALAGRQPGDLEVQAFLELARGALLRTYRARVGSGTVAPRVRASPAEVMKCNLPAAAGFLLSLIDGCLSIDELLAVSGMDPFETLRTLSNLLDTGIVEARG